MMSDNLSELIAGYILLEKEILKRTYQISHAFCAECLTKCCKEEICRESLESPFLSKLVSSQKVKYDNVSGWLSPIGCRLEYGRPLVCHEFFCEDILNNRHLQFNHLMEIINGFIRLGIRARGNIHLICVDDPVSISEAKIEKMIQRIKSLTVDISAILGNIPLHESYR